MTSSFSILRASKIQLIASLILFFDFKSHLAIALGHSRLIHWFYCTFNQSLACRKIVAFMFTLSHPHTPQTQLKGAFYLDSHASSSKDTLQKSRELDNEVEVTTSTHTHFYWYFSTLDFQTSLLVQCFKSSQKTSISKNWLALFR